MLLFYPIIIVLGIFTSYSDIRFRKIKNNHLIVAIIFGIIVHAYLALKNVTFFNSFLLINFLIGFSLGFLLYWTGTWGAGDAKLFAVFCLLMPTNKYSQLIPYPAIVVFINIFLLSALFILALSIEHVIKNKKLFLKKMFSLQPFKELGNSFITIFALGWLISPLTDFFRKAITPFIYVLILFFSYVFLKQLMKKLKKRYLSFVILGLGIISRLIFQPPDFSFFRLLAYFRSTFFYALFFYFLMNIYSLNREERKNERIIPFAPLMFLGTLTANSCLIYWVMHLLNMIKK